MAIPINVAKSVDALSREVRAGRVAFACWLAVNHDGTISIDAEGEKVADEAVAATLAYMGAHVLTAFSPDGEDEDGEAEG
jgi:hypothetical protein